MSKGDLNQNINDSIQSIEQTTSVFYQQNKELGYSQLDKTISLLSSVINDILTYKNAGNDIGVDENKIVQTLSGALKAMEEKDTILLSDILQYELIDVLNTVKNTL